MRIHIARVAAPIVGILHLAATSHGVVAVRLDGDEAALRSELVERFPGAEFARGNGVASEAAREIRRYLEGGRDPDVEVVLPEAGFTGRVWREIRRIPRGAVRSYKRIARAVGRPDAARAVGQACGRNPVPLVVPCHRVIASDGTLGGFSADLGVKRALLALEGAPLRAR